MQSWAEPLRSAALRGRRGRLGFSSKLQTAWLRLRWRTGCCQLRPERRLRAARPRRGGLGCCTSPAGGGGWRTQGGGPLTAGHAPPWSSPTGAPPARISSRTLFRDAQARALAPARSRARARAHVCTTLKLSTTRSVKFTVKSITHVVELTQSTLRKRKLDNNTVKLTSRQVDGPSDSQLDSVIRYSELDGRQLDYETRQLDLAGPTDARDE